MGGLVHAVDVGGKYWPWPASVSPNDPVFPGHFSELGPTEQCTEFGTRMKSHMFYTMELAEKCRNLVEQLQAVSQSFIGLGACIINWAISPEAQLARKEQGVVAELVLRYALPCRQIDLDSADQDESNVGKVGDKPIGYDPDGGFVLHHHAERLQVSELGTADSQGESKTAASLWYKDGGLPQHPPPVTVAKAAAIKDKLRARA